MIKKANDWLARKRLRRSRRGPAGDGVHSWQILPSPSVLKISSMRIHRFRSIRIPEPGTTSTIPIRLDVISTYRSKRNSNLGYRGCRSEEEVAKGFLASD